MVRSTTPSIDETTTLTGPWTKGKILGRGAVGTVFLAQLHDGRQAACKQIATEGLKGDDLKAIVREITLIQSLHHANLTQYIGIEYAAAPTHKLSIFMEFAPGGSVRQLLKAKGALDESICASYIDQVLQGLEYLHTNGIAHRDVKGANVLLSHDLTGAQLADFGASKRIEKLGEDASGGGASGLRGTPRWMAPELIRGELSGDLEGWILSDVWSVGCTLVEMATGQLPWPQFPNPMAAMFHISQGIAPPLGSTQLSAACADFLGLCCRPAPSDRPSPSELRTHSFLTLLARRPPTGLAPSCERPAAPPAGAERRPLKPKRAPPSPPAGSFVQVEGRPRNRTTAPAPRDEPASPTKKASLAAAFPILQRLADAASELVSPTSPEVQPRPRKPKKNKRRVRLEQKLARPAHKPPREASSPPVLERPRAALAGDRLGRLSRSDGFINIGSRVRDEARRELERSGPVQARHSRSARAATRTLPPVSGARRGVSSAPTIRWPAVRRSI
ncbi:unnamed protein product [Pelagomonas calceolata]|uniref:Protein kinase domain-containing protein n=1 Tax=Pelagomonas calceolata TaxID=35677 RepID=A0A7S4E6M1_9STRA|nr:unnamed protein product [Pelagomonas calceolata]|mmetsp:Transcript_21305/g.55604  ORF Transcript_21305/g.55604 Transcript_21305/m.55604 type:complete len:504 (-) Transcript_21305:51-1562(-)